MSRELFIDRAMSFACPGVEARLLDEDVVETAAEAELLFREVKRFLVLSRTLFEPCPMISMRVDAGWHAFILFTDDYARFCHGHLGGFMAHDPGAPRMAVAGDTLPRVAREEARAAEDPRTFFAREYAALFGAPPGPMWQDELAVHPARRLKNPSAGQLDVRLSGEKSEKGEKVELVDRAGVVRARLPARAAPALEFLARQRRFFVRELPGLSKDADRVALGRALVKSGTLELCI